jgi:hypothetical protein
MSGEVLSEIKMTSGHKRMLLDSETITMLEMYQPAPTALGMPPLPHRDPLLLSYVKEFTVSALW